MNNKKQIMSVEDLTSDILSSLYSIKHLIKLIHFWRNIRISNFKRY